MKSLTLMTITLALLTFMSWQSTGIDITIRCRCSVVALDIFTTSGRLIVNDLAFQITQMIIT